MMYFSISLPFLLYPYADFQTAYKKLGRLCIIGEASDSKKPKLDYWEVGGTQTVANNHKKSETEKLYLKDQDIAFISQEWKNKF